MTVTTSQSWLHSLSNAHFADGKTNGQDHTFSYHGGRVRTRTFWCLKPGSSQCSAQMTDGLLQRPSTRTSTQNYRIWDLWKQSGISLGDILGCRVILRRTTDVLITRRWRQRTEPCGHKPGNVLGEARSENEGRKAVFSRSQGSMASLTPRCPASTTHSCHFKPNSVWPFVPAPLCNLLRPALLNMAGRPQGLRASSPAPT